MELKTAKIVAVASFALASAWKLGYEMHRRLSKSDRAAGGENEIHDVIMFHDGQKGHYLKGAENDVCLDNKSKGLGRMIHYINMTRETLDVCIYLVTSVDIASRLVRLHSQGCRVRVIADADMAYCSGSQIKLLQKFNVPVRWLKTTYLMHHKFCVVDGPLSVADRQDRAGERGPPLRALALSGSLNWTNQALHGNCDNVVVTTQPEIVRKFELEFCRLWELCQPAVM